MRILVTGSSGFIARHLYKTLLAKTGHQVLGVSRRATSFPYEIDWEGWSGKEVYCDLTQERRVADLMLRYKPDAVFHLAGNPLIKPDSEDPTRITHDNVVATHNLLAYCKPGTRFVFASSCAVYGDARSYTNESYPVRPTSLYGATKAAGEMLVQTHDVNGLCLRLAATVGAGATHGLVPDIIRKIRSDSPTLDLLGDAPGSRKPYTHVLDVVDGFIKLGLKSDLCGALVLANENPITVEQVASLITLHIGRGKPVRWLGARANWRGDNPLVLPDSSLAKRHGWKPFFGNSEAAVARAATDIMESLR